MKLIIVMMTTCLMQVTAATFAQKLTYSKKGASLEEIFKEIKKQTGYNVLYSPEKVDDTQKIDVYFKETALPEVLEKVASGQALEYTINDKNISLKPKESTFLDRLAKRWASIDANGSVVDSENRPLPGASVKVKATGKAVSTDEKGRFFLRGVEEGALLVVSFIGYLPKEVSASANMGSVVLEQSLSKLDEVQVIAYGTTTRRLGTGNISTVKAEDIEKQPVNNPLLALQGRVPGVFIEQSTGISGGAIKVRIQGQNSIAKGNDPLYVIDGMPYVSQLLPSSNGSPLNGGSAMSFISSADIESIDVLKDADATAIYGSRAANGAILITTKKGKAGDVRVDVNLQSGFGTSRQLNLLNTQQYLEMRHEALKNDNRIISATDYDLNGQWDTTRYTNWQKELFGGTSKYQDFQGSISGGSTTTQFIFGAGYHKETTVFPGDVADAKGSVKLGVSNSSENQKFKIQVNVSYFRDDNHLPQYDLTQYAVQYPPDAPMLYNTNGSLNWSPDGVGNSTFENPLAYYAIRKYNNKTNNLISNVNLSYQILPGLDLKSAFGYTNLQTNELNIVPQLASSPEYSAYNMRSAIWGNSNINSWNIEPQLTYSKLIGKGKLDILIGTTLQQKNSHSLGLYGNQQISDAVLEDFKSALVVSVNSTLEEIYKYNALFGRLNYIWNDRYIININARRDGSSRFGSENQFHNFGSIAAAWIFSEEKFLKNNLSFLSFGKLKGSYGTTGNDQIGEYQFLSVYNPINKTNPYQGVSGLKPRNLANPNVAWEETKKLQGGIDLGFLEDKLILNATYSLNRSSNQLINSPLSAFAGLPNIYLNLPATIQNSGWEFSFLSNNLVKKNFKWTSVLNLTIQKSKLASFPGLEQSTYANWYFVGKPVTGKMIYHSLGVDPISGVYQFADRDGNITYSPSDRDKTIFVDESPVFYGGLQNHFTYKGFDLDFLFQFVKQKAFGNKFGYNPGAYFMNQPTSILSRWQKPGDQTNVQRFNSDYSLYQAWAGVIGSDANWSDASYIRLKNLSVSWQLLKEIKKVLHLENCKLYAQGENLFTITKYTGLDPETKNLYSLPPLRVITFGVKIGL
ncbi:SusC/RagA family TonB-linked outer membrane protein [Pedobacter sp. HMWF019]|uniref:SusC/RagA family TonB-linked outer membrane protein n=1 Tax=Pedobacter sp. HMWF019 TaxID=2056856 RepID=UPI00130495C8|nr:SusC/RagA family TonB-linked outer membrane protein [Pedobacter sp. HMWF019]